MRKLQMYEQLWLCKGPFTFFHVRIRYFKCRHAATKREKPARGWFMMEKILSKSQFKMLNQTKSKIKF